jgi:hypothetical protein
MTDERRHWFAICWYELAFWLAVFWLYHLAVTPPANGQPPWCKVHCGDGSLGSGTLIDRNDKQGLVVTAFHVVRDVMRGNQQAAEVRCEFENHAYGGRVVSYDSTRDLCAIIINRPDIRPVMLAAYNGEGTHTIFGFPGGGQLRPMPGRIVDDTRFLLGEGDYPVAVLSAPAYGGHSGGAVATDRGMVGVIWGCDDDGHATMSCGKPFDEFCVSLTQCYSCQQGQCWGPSEYYSPGGRQIGGNNGGTPSIDSEPPPQQQTTPTKPPLTADELRKSWQDYIDKQLSEIKQCECDERGYATKGDIEAIVAKIALKPGPPGPVGPAGPQGPVGSDGQPGEAPQIEQPTTESHIVIVADRNTPWWERLSGEIATTKQTYSGIQVTGLPPFPIGEIPQAVVYESGVPVRVVKGERNVLDLLSRVKRGMPI